MKRLLLIAGLLAVCGCSAPTPKENNSLELGKQTGRMQVVSAQYIRDVRGYGRDILVIKDTETGKEYLAVMGAGVMDMRTVSNGKSTYQQED